MATLVKSLSVPVVADELTEYKMDGYRFQPDRVFDGKHNGIEMYDRHFQMMLLQPTDQ
jgi:hypothetical protein